MPRQLRILLAVVAFFSLAAAGCGKSEQEKKLVGVWEGTIPLPPLDEDDLDDADQDADDFDLEFGPDTSPPGIVNPAGVNQPGANQPGANQPGANQPAVNQPGANQPGANQPGANQPGANQPGVNQSGVNQPGVNQPGANQPGANQPGVNQPNANQPVNPPANPLPAQPADDAERQKLLIELQENFKLRYEFHEDGTMTVKYPYMDQPLQGTWSTASENDAKLVIKTTVKLIDLGGFGRLARILGEGDPETMVEKLTITFLSDDKIVIASEYEEEAPTTLDRVK